MAEDAGRPEAPNAEELRARAEALLPQLSARTAEAERLRRVPEQTIADLQAAGLFRLLQPRRWGGFEVDPQTFFDVQTAIATACPSTAWVYGVVGVHAWQLALFPLEAQEEVWGSDTSVLISSSYAPTGKVERVDGGFKLSGRWSFSSGCDHCRWVFLGGLCPPVAEGQVAEMRTFLVPRADYRIEDTWFVSGLKATGSKDVVVDGAFIPEHRTHKMIDGFRRSSPGNEINTAPLFRLPFGQVFVRSVSTSAIGIALGALEVYRQGATRRIAAGDGAKVAEDPRTQTVCAESAATIDEVQLVLRRNFDEMMAMVRADKDLPLERRLRFRYDSSRAVDRCVQVVDALFTASGGRALFLDSPIQRYFQDAHAARAHYANNPDKPARNWGGVQLKLKNQDYFV
jgi:3-hydroxy-9,10-secoandrosta-1,3,5(10)-triene-9,17-dione monooxygenase